MAIIGYSPSSAAPHLLLDLLQPNLLIELRKRHLEIRHRLHVGRGAYHIDHPHHELLGREFGRLALWDEGIRGGRRAAAAAANDDGRRAGCPRHNGPLDEPGLDEVDVADVPSPAAALSFAARVAVVRPPVATANEAVAVTAVTAGAAWAAALDLAKLDLDEGRNQSPSVAIRP